jgi:2-keto-3-deoxy-L-rhamnonate aldolase RhmA
MHAIELKRKWASGAPSPGFWVRLTDPTVVELVGEVGYDWVMFDAEHVAFDFQTLQILFIALKGTSTVPLVRVPWNDFVFIKRVLDIGAEGVLVPHIKTSDDARAAVAACKYPPSGIRGAGPRRPGRYGILEREYIAGANDRTIVLLMIETIEAVRNIDDILAVEGVDGIILGPVDLATSMGLYGDFERAEVQQAIDEVIGKARSAAIAFGDGRPSPDQSAWLDRGAQLLPLGDDEMFVRQGAYGALAAFHAGLDRRAPTAPTA